MVRIDPLRLLLTVPQQDVGRIQRGQTVRFHVDSFPDQTFEARVRLVAPIVSNDTRSMVIEAEAKNPGAVLLPGMFVTAEVVLSNESDGVYVPAEAVLKKDDQASVFIVRDDGVVREKVVALGPRNGDKVEIREGLAGDELLVARPDGISDGDKVGP